MSNLMIFGAIAGVAASAVTVLKARHAAVAPHAVAKFKAKQLLTANEMEFLARLEAAVAELRFLAQVAMGALIDPAVPRDDGKAYYRLRAMFSQKIVDFVAQCRSDGRVVAIIELDDRTHDRDKDSRRDNMLTSTGYRIVRWKSKSKPDGPAIRAALLPALHSERTALNSESTGRPFPKNDRPAEEYVGRGALTGCKRYSDVPMLMRCTLPAPSTAADRATMIAESVELVIIDRCD